MDEVSPNLVDFGYREIVICGSRGNSVIYLQALNEFSAYPIVPRAMLDELSYGHTHELLGCPVIHPKDRKALYPDLPVLIGVGSSSLIRKFWTILTEEGAELATFRGNPRRVSRDLQVGEGTLIINPATRIGPDCRFGKATQILARLVGHDVTVGDFSTLKVDCAVLGHVKIGENVSIAPYAVIGNGTPDRPLVIGDGATIGTGAVVLTDVPAGATVVGNPARRLKSS